MITKKEFGSHTVGRDDCVKSGVVSDGVCEVIPDQDAHRVSDRLYEVVSDGRLEVEVITTNEFGSHTVGKDDRVEVMQDCLEDKKVVETASAVADVAINGVVDKMIGQEEVTEKVTEKPDLVAMKKVHHQGEGGGLQKMKRKYVKKENLKEISAKLKLTKINTFFKTSSSGKTTLSVAELSQGQRLQTLTPEGGTRQQTRLCVDQLERGSCSHDSFDGKLEADWSGGDRVKL